MNEERIAYGMSVGLVVALLAQIWLSLISQIDPTMTVASRTLGIVVNTIVAVGVLVVHRGIVRGTHVRGQRWIVWCVLILPVLFEGFTDAWAMIAMSHAMAWLLFRPRFAIQVTAVLLAAQPFTMMRIADDHPLITSAITVITFIAAAIFYVLTRLIMVLRDFALTREHLARIQVDQDRQRISRELHDIMGRTLVAVSMRQQAATRLLDRDLEAARVQLEETNRLVRDGQGHLRRVINGETVVSLASEIEAAHNLFSRLEISLDVNTPEELPGDLDHLAGRLLREAVTNLLKHSRARHVQVRVRQEATTVVLLVLNDGAPEAKATPSSGTGLSDLAERVEAVGGSLDASFIPPDRFRLIARLPHVRQETTHVALPTYPAISTADVSRVGSP